MKEFETYSDARSEIWFELEDNNRLVLDDLNKLVKGMRFCIDEYKKNR